MASKPLPSPEVLRQLLSYDPETGKLFWKERGPEWFDWSKSRTREHKANNWNALYAGKEALSAKDGPYLQGSIFDKKYRAHRVIWALFYGEWPKMFVDHKNCDGTDNRISNLRLANNSQNMCNQGVPRRNTSGFKGVSLHRKSGRWDARVRLNGRQYCLGLFDTREAAALAHSQLAKKLHGEFARTI